MSNSPVAGRHRAPGRYSPLSELRAVVAGGGSTTARSASVLAASGGLVAVLAMPTSASATTNDSNAAAKSGSATAATPGTAVAVKAPTAVTPAATTDFGAMAFTAVAKPKPKPKPVVRVVTQAASRSEVRTPVAAPSTGRSQSPAPAPKPAEPTRPATGGVLGIAASLSGIPYVYGGSTPAGFDCSGFTMYVFNKVGISLPRTAEQQRQATTRVSNPQPGDLVFFGAPAYHVGIYAGNGMMYDSPTTGKTSGLHKIWSTNVTYGRP